MDTYVRLDDILAILYRLQYEATKVEDTSKVRAYIDVRYELDSISKYWF